MEEDNKKEKQKKSKTKLHKATKDQRRGRGL